MSKKNNLSRVLFLLLVFCLLFIGCTKNNKDGNNSTKQIKENDVGVFNLTGIPMNYEGLYVFFNDNDYNLFGADTINSFKDMNNLDLLLSKISNGSVNIPLWNQENKNRYSGNHSFREITVEVYEKSQLYRYYDENDTNYIYDERFDNRNPERRIFDNVMFENGNASRNWTDGYNY